MNTNNIWEWEGYAREAGLSDYEMDKFIVWEERNYTPEGFGTLAQIIKIVADTHVNQAEYDRRKNELYQEYVGLMAYQPMLHKFGVDFNKRLTFAEKEPYLKIVTERIAWQMTELQHFVLLVWQAIPNLLLESPVKIASSHYDETLKVERTQQDLVNEMAQELIDLRPHTAYVKSAWKGKIQTLGVAQAPGGQLVDVSVSAWYNAIITGILKSRTDIEEEIRERQERWRRRRGNEPPPPTHTGGNTPPSLPSGSAGSDREPPPTHYVPEKPPEEKPQGKSDVSRQGTGTYTPPTTEEKLMLAQPRNWAAEVPSKPPPPLELESLKFFESGKGIPDIGERCYSTGFPQRTARYINCDLTIRNRLYKQGSEAYALRKRYFNPAGSLLWESQEEKLPKFNNERLSYATGVGWAEPGRWRVGTYRMEILINGVRFAEGSFTIE